MPTPYQQTLDYILGKFNLTPGPRQGPTEFNLSRHWNHGHGDSLVKLWAELGYEHGAEIGTEQGKFAEEICKANPGMRLNCVDPWLAYYRYADHVSQPKLDGFYEEAVQRLGSFNKVGAYCNIIRATSLQAVGEFQDGALDFVYIDGNHHFDFVVMDIIAWAPKVRPGGIVAGHDYRGKGKERPPIPFHVPQAINAYTDAHEIKPWFVMRGDKSASWMFIKS